MTELFPLLAAAIVLIGALTSLVLWARYPVGVKVAALGTAATSIVVAGAGFASLLSMPKPVGLEWWQASADDATVLGSTMREDVGIYLWLQLRDVREPRAYVLPWDRELAEQLQEAQREAEQNESALRMRRPFEPSLDDRAPKFYALPQLALPPKPEPPAAKVIERDV